MRLRRRTLLGQAAAVGAATIVVGNVANAAESRERSDRIVNGVLEQIDAEGARIAGSPVRFHRTTRLNRDGPATW